MEDLAEAGGTGLPVAVLVARIIEQHHGYLRRGLPGTARLVEKIAEVHGAKEPALVELAAAFAALRARLEADLEEEETELFPLLMTRAPDPERSAAGLARLRAAHAAAEVGMARVRSLAGDFAPPAWACRTYRTALADLEDLEAELGRHLHLEARVLAARFPGPA